jgi:hypothetical protein
MGRLPPGGALKLFVVALFVVCAIGFPVGGFIARDSAATKSDGDVTLGIAAGLGVLFLIGAYAIYRQVRAPRLRHVRVSVAKPEVRRGGHVDVQFEITNPSKVSERLELGLVCTEYYAEETTDGKGNKSRTTSNAVAHAEWRPQDRNGGVQSLRFEVPAAGPYSYRGDCVSYVWRVSAREPKKLRFDPATDVELTVRP